MREKWSILMSKLPQPPPHHHHHHHHHHTHHHHTHHTHHHHQDMLQVGNVGMSEAEQRSHFMLWCIAGAPLLIGTDIVHASAPTLALLTAPELLAVNQDLGAGGKLQGTFVGAATAAGGAGAGTARNQTSSELWVKTLADGSVVVVVLSLEDTDTVDLLFTWAIIGLPADAAATARDLWLRKELGSFTGQFTVRALLPHSAVMVKLTTAR
jgi:alpha-galactosidase